MHVLGIGLDKIVIIAFFAALLLSPSQLLAYAKKIGFYAGKIRVMSDLVKKQFVDATSERKVPVGDFSVTDDEAT
ncbi:twin-arginine translocase TatA/TatE family subunit [Tropheryma whipplei]|uniref:Uncharacterized protein n=1 Tax=Tropheryma whipplei (strain Twist) TaxID=203267 RepID=Q83FX4_TROWT|nr:hypothetical protein [Tropheryma whipplei]AAO44667.1 unknown [Tropheryma whipplei str. Twist]MCO8182983.1 hypothetical protein [Tropheryma whipplei]MCO8190636.1 hypothetical protein [Tropheryma whipplei]CAD66868.1 putative secreted protein [Tropheryma whipplei TW08/27]